MGRARCAVEAVLLDFLSGQDIAAGDALAVAYSGGPDSTALLAALAAIGWQRPLALHVDHGLRDRPELDAELDLAKGNAASLGARLLVAHVRPGALLTRAKARGESVEAEARRYRYAALRSMLARSGAKAVLLGHTRDDNIETLLMRLFGGSSSGGLAGIPETSGPFMRPFLGLEKTQLLSYLDSRGIAWSTDSTNASDDYLRNRVRRTLVPALDTTFPGWRSGLALTAAKAEQDEIALAAAAHGLMFSPSRSGENELSLPERLFLEAPEAIAIRALLPAAGALLGRERLPARLATAAIDAIRGGPSARYIGAGLELFRRDGLVILRRSPAHIGRGGLDFPKRDGYFVLIDRPRRVRMASLVVSASWNPGEGRGIRADAFRFPLVVRSRRPGDSISLAVGSKRLDALFSDWALSEAARSAAPVVEDRDGIVAVLGEGFGGKDRYRAGPKGECAHRLSIIVKGA